MALSITHQFVSAIPDGGDATIVQPSNWNATHTIGGLGTNVQTFLETPTSSNLAAALTDETGTGAAVFANTPTLVTPVIGAATGTSLAASGFLSVGTIPSGINNFELIVTGTLRQAVFDRSTTSDYSEFAFSTGGDSGRDWTIGTRAGSSDLFLGYAGTSGLNAATWKIMFSTGHLFAHTDNTYDIGASGANRPRSIYAGTQFQGPTGSAVTPSFIVGASGPGLYNNGGGLGFALGSVEVMFMGSNRLRLDLNTDLTFNDDLYLIRTAAASLQQGATDVDLNANIVAQTLRSQGALTGGTNNQAGKNWTFIASPGKGTGAGGSFIFQTAPAGGSGNSVNAPVTALTIDSTSLCTFANSVIRINQTPTAVGTGTKTISNSADSSTNFGHYFSINMNGTTYYVPCGATAPT